MRSGTEQFEKILFSDSDAVRRGFVLQILRAISYVCANSELCTHHAKWIFLLPIFIPTLLEKLILSKPTVVDL